MRISVITIFPGWFEGVLSTSVVARAIETGALAVELVDLREHGLGAHRQIDDAPFGGGAGMVMMIEPLAEAIDELGPSLRVLLTPVGRPLDQATLDRWASLPHLALICGRYEGIDERVAEHLVDEEVSLGDFVLPGAEAAAAAVIEGIARLLPGVVGNPESIVHESFRDGLLEHPQYTRPASFRGWEVPEVLLSGDHARIDRWRQAQRIERTRRRRPDLIGPDHGEGDPAAD
ncbi:MAG TPA: tRNA (guanosine(37)-N1)-methyltransferase TrmD [Acidimicrobiia bacterium]